MLCHLSFNLYFLFLLPTISSTFAESLQARIDIYICVSIDLSYKSD